MAGNENGSVIKEGKVIKITLGAFITIILSVIGATFSLTMIYSRFLEVDHQLEVVKERVEEVNKRIDRRVDPIEEALKVYNQALINEANE